MMLQCTNVRPQDHENRIYVTIVYRREEKNMDNREMDGEEDKGRKVQGVEG